MKNINRIFVKHKDTEINMSEKIANRAINLGWAAVLLFGVSGLLKAIPQLLDSIKGL